MLLSRIRSVPVAAALCLFAGVFEPTVAAAQEEETFKLRAGATGYPVVNPTRAHLRDPHFGMRFAYWQPAPGTLPDDSGRHIIWDVAFGGSLPIVSYLAAPHNDERITRHANGLRLNFDVGTFMMLDFSSQSAGVINTDFRIGASVDLRPPWVDMIALKLGAYHQSTHLGDEYVLTAESIDGALPPETNPNLPYRVNPSDNPVYALLSVDALRTRCLHGRAYGALSAMSLLSQRAIEAAGDYESRIGVDLRIDFRPKRLEDGPVGRPSPAGVAASDEEPDEFSKAVQSVTHAPEPAAGSLLPGPLSLLIAYELLWQTGYELDQGATNAAERAVFRPLNGGDFWTHHFLVQLLTNERNHPAPSAWAFGLEYFHGRNQHGQLVEYHEIENGVAASLAYYW